MRNEAAPQAGTISTDSSWLAGKLTPLEMNVLAWWWTGQLELQKQSEGSRPTGHQHRTLFCGEPACLQQLLTMHPSAPQLESLPSIPYFLTPSYSACASYWFAKTVFPQWETGAYSTEWTDVPFPLCEKPLNPLWWHHCYRKNYVIYTYSLWHHGYNSSSFSFSYTLILDFSQLHVPFIFAKYQILHDPNSLQNWLLSHYQSFWNVGEDNCLKKYIESPVLWFLCKTPMHFH